MVSVGISLHVGARLRYSPSKFEFDTVAFVPEDPLFSKLLCDQKQVKRKDTDVAASFSSRRQSVLGGQGRR
jgi:hypothetical protein